MSTGNDLEAHLHQGGCGQQQQGRPELRWFVSHSFSANLFVLSQCLDVGGSYLAVGMDVSHDIMLFRTISTLLSQLNEKSQEIGKTYTELGLVVPGDGEGLVGHDDVGTHLLEGIVRDGETQLLLGLGQPDPELAPGAGTLAGREDGHHLLRGIPRAEGGLSHDESGSVMS